MVKKSFGTLVKDLWVSVFNMRSGVQTASSDRVLFWATEQGGATGKGHPLKAKQCLKRVLSSHPDLCYHCRYSNGPFRYITIGSQNIFLSDMAESLNFHDTWELHGKLRGRTSFARLKMRCHSDIHYRLVHFEASISQNRQKNCQTCLSYTGIIW